MHLLIAFPVMFVLFLLLLLFLVGYARHLGDASDTDWVTVMMIAIVLSAIATGAFAVVWEIAHLASGLFR